jgi:ASC-1-like (ASCH) protein
MNSKEIKLKIIAAGQKAVEQLIKVAKEEIIKHDPEDDISADRLKNAAATKKLAIFDAFEILKRIELEKEEIEASEKAPNKSVDTKQGFAERRSR